MVAAVWVTVDLIGAVYSLVSAVCVVTGADTGVDDASPEVDESVCWVVGVAVY